FLARLTERLAGVVMGDPLDEATNFGPLVSAAQRDKVMGFITRAQAEGARLVCGGTIPDRPGFFVAPTVFADVTDDMEVARDEVFGPVMSVLDFDSEEEVLARANATEFGLSAGVFTRDLTRAHRVIARLQAGTCFINSYNDAPVEVPFGGTKASGVGRENARAAIEHYSQLKSVFVRMGPVEAPY
ncbi:MAG TPA: betaine-aldehyde dehydrogenase, partial [Citreicella sp.]|nr:betaine-aldehyde dehydrogenase [Citreicella sp.]